MPWTRCRRASPRPIADPTGTCRPLPAGVAGASLIVMESRSDLAADLPVLYRAALDAVDELSQLGLRRDASKLRDRAIRAYSQSWDEGCRRTLERCSGQSEGRRDGCRPVRFDRCPEPACTAERRRRSWAAFR